MSFQDRPYYRDSDQGAAMFGGGVSRLRMWSVTTWLIMINIAVFVLDGLLVRFGVQVGVRVPGGVVALAPLEAWGHFSLARGIVLGQVWRLITFQFLHAGLGHIFFNMLALYFFGPMVEQHLGSRRFLAFYLLCGVAGAVMYPLLLVSGVLIDSPWTSLVGASAGIFGVLLAAARIAPQQRVMLLFPPIPMSLRTLAWVMVGIAVYFVLTAGRNAGGEAAHLGGALVGYVLIRRPGWLMFVEWGSRRGGGLSWSQRWQQRRQQRQADEVRRMDAEVDRILAKVSQHGLHSLTEKEKRTLNRATERRNAG